MIEILCSNIKDGNMSSKFSSDGRDNRLKYFSNHSIKRDDTIYLNIQNDNIIFDTNYNKEYLTNKYGDPIVNADALVTTDNKFIFCLFGDCIPLIMYDEKRKIVCLLHLGWKSVEAKLHIKVLEYLKNKYNSNVSDIKIYLGPSIKKESHKIDLKENIKQKDNKEWKKYIDSDEKYYYIDLVGYVVNSLKEKGITNIEVDKIDTYKSNLYFSHHRSWMENKTNGRFIYGVRMKRG